MTLSSKLRKRSINIHGHATSYTLEDPFFDFLRKISEERGMPLAALVGEVDDRRDRAVNLSSALRLFVLDNVLTRLNESTGQNY